MSTIVQNKPTDAPAGPPAPVRAPSMRVIPTIVALAGVLLLAFGLWGTHGGIARFGDGFVPIAAGSLGGLLLIAGVLVDIIADRRLKKSAR